MTTCYEVWRYFGYNRKTDVYEYQELIGRDGNSGSAMFLLGRLTGLRQLTPNGPVDFDAGHAKWGMEFLDLLGYSLVSPDVGRFASFFDSEDDAVMYAEINDIEIFREDNTIPYQ